MREDRRSREKTSPKVWAETEAQYLSASREYTGSRPVLAKGAPDQHQGASDGRPKALICCGKGVGDVIQSTPLMKAVSLLGYDVDVWMVPDYSETVGLLEGWSAVRHVFLDADDADRDGYDKLLIGVQFPYSSTFAYQTPHVRLWRDVGRLNQAEADLTLARELGYAGVAPSSFARRGRSRLELPPDTVALHPGSNPGRWNRGKRWPYFPELASLLLAAGYGVALVGTEDDATRGEEWPRGVIDARGRLSLLDTGALIDHCSALVANDSGITHYGAAVGTTTFVIFGPTDPRVYAPLNDNAIVITSDAGCGPCAIRRDCHDRACLLGLDPRIVAGRVIERCRRERSSSTDVRVALTAGSASN